MLFQRPYSSKSDGGACPWTPLAALAFGTRDRPPPPPPPPPNKSNLATALSGMIGQNFKCAMYRADFTFKVCQQDIIV